MWWRGARLVVLGAAPLLAASLFGVEAWDLASFTVAVTALFAVAACLPPAWRAMHVHPTESLCDA